MIFFLHSNLTISTIFSFLVEKRTSPQQNVAAPISNISELKASPPLKKIVPRRLPSAVASPQEKSPLKGELIVNLLIEI
jgi:hypothetical protein